MAKRAAKFKVGQVVAEHYRDKTRLGHGDPLRIGWVERHNDGFVYRKTKWASWGYLENELRPLTKREAGR